MLECCRLSIEGLGDHCRRRALSTGPTSYLRDSPKFLCSALLFVNNMKEERQMFET